MTRAASTLPNRRALITGLAAAPALATVPAFASPHPDALSPALAALKVKFDGLAEIERALSAAYDSAPQGAAQVEAEKEWQDSWADMTDVAWEILKSPVTSPADLRFKLSVWGRAVRLSEDSDDLEERELWFDRAPFRLLADAQQILAGEG